MTLVIFDIGATLVTGPDRGPWSRLAGELSLDATQKASLREIVMTRDFASPAHLTSVVDDLAGVDSSDAVERLWHAQTSEAQPLQGARAAIEGLLDAGLELALISNIWRPYLLSVQRHFGDLFAQIPSERRVFSFREGIAKPAPELFERLLERARTPAHESVMVGDSYLEDIAPAASLGIATVWLLHRPERERELIERVRRGEAEAPRLTLDSISQLDPEAVKRALSIATENGVPCA